MTKLLIVAHAPLASALKAVAVHTYADCAPNIETVDVPDDWDHDRVAAAVRSLLAQRPGTETLLLTDVFGATPGKGSAALADAPGVRVLVGVNVPMVLRPVCSGLDAPVDQLAECALVGAERGIMPLGTLRRQDQPKPPGRDDQEDPDDQQ
jgi:PTS system ascorbate-specific IIA component